jgi:signal transduction histidine kinase
MREDVFDLSECARQVIDDLAATANRTIALDAESEPAMVVADEQRQRRVLTNLLANAVRYSNAPEPIKVLIRRTQGEGNEVFEVSVSDRGVGIAPIDQPKVFEKFPRFEHPAAERAVQHGTGLGLYITRRLVELQGGSISFDSTLGKGSTFRYTVPVAPQQQ